MGEVYRARDVRLGRDVAVKVLPQRLTTDPDRMRRFEQEARAAAALNHPNILALYDIGEHGGIPYLVTELLEGSDLRDLLHHPSRLRKNLDYAWQLARGLAAAHDRGIVHRDLKPANIFITNDGRVKILDFGLAKLTEGAAPSASAATVTVLSATEPGVVMGTAGYMAPEQVRGAPADHRADIFAFGAVLYEVFAGQRAFRGDTTIDVMAAIVRDDPPDLTDTHRHLPAWLVRVVNRCLEKDPSARYQSTHDLAFSLEAIMLAPGGETEATAAMTPPAAFRRRPIAAAAALAIVGLAALASALIVIGRRGADSQTAVELVVAAPTGWSTRTNTGTARNLALSPDGRQLAFAAADASGRSTIWLRSLDDIAPRALAATDHAGSLFWSPDGRFLAFVADGRLKRIDVFGGPPQIVANTAIPLGGDWAADGTIVFNAIVTGGLSRVSASGGTVGPVTTLAPGEIRHVSPHFLPDGRHFLFGSFDGTNAVHVGSLDSIERKEILRDVGLSTAYSGGRLFFTRAGTLMAQTFELANMSLVGEPEPVAEIPAGQFDVAQNGVLAYQSGVDASQSRLEWVDRQGKPAGSLGAVANYYTVEMSPDGSRAAGGIPERVNALASDVWMYDLTGQGRTRLTFDAEHTLGRAVWAPEGNRLVYMKRRRGQASFDLFQRAVDGSGTEQAVLESPVSKQPLSWSTDGRFLLYLAAPGSAATGNDLWVFPFAPGRQPFPFLQTRFSETAGQFSPNGRWIAYVSTESGRPEIYAAAFPGAGGTRQVSTGGGTFVRWRRDGKEMYYLALNGTLMAATVDSDSEAFEVKSVQPLFATSLYGDFPFDVSRDGQRFLTISAQGAGGASGIVVAMPSRP